MSRTLSSIPASSSLFSPPPMVPLELKLVLLGPPPLPHSSAYRTLKRRRVVDTTKTIMSQSMKDVIWGIWSKGGLSKQGVVATRRPLSFRSSHLLAILVELGEHDQRGKAHDAIKGALGGEVLRQLEAGYVVPRHVEASDERRDQNSQKPGPEEEDGEDEGRDNWVPTHREEAVCLLSSLYAASGSRADVNQRS